MVVEQEMAEIYPPDAEDLIEYLPDLDCRQCDCESCVEFAEAILERRIDPHECPELEGDVRDTISAIVALDQNPIPYDVMMPQEECSLIEVCHPTRDAPFLITANFKETVRIIREILEQTATPSFLLPTNTHGYSVDNAVHEHMFRAIEVFKAMNENGVSEKVNRPMMIIPGLAAREKSAIRRLTHWEVIEGPVSGFLLPLFLKTI